LLRMEFSPELRAYETSVTLWPGARNRAIARSDGHGQGIAWIA